MARLQFIVALVFILLSLVLNAHTYRISLQSRKQPPTASAGNSFGSSKRFEGSSPFVEMRYHMGPVLTSNIRVYVIWYGNWKLAQKSIIRDFLCSISSAESTPSVAAWWSTVQLYTDQTGSNISRSLLLAAEHRDHYSHGKILSRMTVQEVIRAAIGQNGSLPVDSKGGLYMVFSAEDVVMQDFCQEVCGFHYFTFPSIVGYTLPYAWIGNSGKQCPELCAYPFAVPSYMIGVTPLKPPNGDIGIEGMISVMGHELAEISSNPLINAWYAGNDPTAPTEIADLCEGIYGSGGGGSYMGSVLVDPSGASYNMNGIMNRKYLVQWVWNPILNYCTGPNALDG